MSKVKLSDIFPYRSLIPFDEKISNFTTTFKQVYPDINFTVKKHIEMKHFKTFYLEINGNKQYFLYEGDGYLYKIENLKGGGCCIYPMPFTTKEDMDEVIKNLNFKVTIKKGDNRVS